MAERITISVAAGGDNAEARAFSAALLDILDILDSIAKERGGKNLQWRIVDVSKNSPPAVTLETTSDLHVVGTFLAGWRNLQTAPIRAFPIRGMRAARRLGRRIKSRRVDSVTVFASASADPVVTTPRVGENAERAIEDKYYRVPSSIEGRLEMVNVHGRAKFGIFDNLHQKEVRCHFPERLFEIVRVNLGKRVLVDGIVKFETETDRPVAITVADVEPLDDGKPLLFSEMPKIDMGEDIPSEQLIRRLRDG